jgi:D-alanine transaminase
MAGEMLHPVEDRRWGYCNIKSVGLLAAVLAKDDARLAGADEALFVDKDGTVREGGSSNVFAYLKGALFTHPADEHILDGITRRRVLELARESGYQVREEAFSLSDMTSGADPRCEVFLVSTLRDIMPVVRVGEHVIGDGLPGQITLALLDLFRSTQAAVAGLEPPAAFS